MNYYLQRITNIFYVFSLFMFYGCLYLYHKDSLKFIKDFCRDIEKFNYTYIKIFQGISCNSLLFSEEQKKFLLGYTNQVPYNKINNNIAVLEDLENNFQEIRIIKDKPINSGIVALVYEGYINNQKVVIKVLKKDVKNLLNKAWDDIDFITKILNYIPYLRTFKNNKILNDNKSMIMNQLDFNEELENLKLWKKYSDKVDYLEVPSYFEKYTHFNKNILVMEFLRSIPFQKLTLSQKKNFSKQIIKTVFVGIFYYGILHGDLHSGNILFLDNKIGLIDFGIASKLNRDEQNAIYIFYKNLLNKKTFEAAELSLVFAEPKHVIENLNKHDKATLLNKLKNNIDMNFTDDTNILKFYFTTTSIFNSYKLVITKALSNTLLTVLSGINISLECYQSKGKNPLKDYNDYSMKVIKELIDEVDLSLD